MDNHKPHKKLGSPEVGAGGILTSLGAQPETSRDHIRHIPCHLGRILGHLILGYFWTHTNNLAMKYDGFFGAYMCLYSAQMCSIKAGIRTLPEKHPMRNLAGGCSQIFQTVALSLTTWWISNNQAELQRFWEIEIQLEECATHSKLTSEKMWRLNLTVHLTSFPINFQWFNMSIYRRGWTTWMETVDVQNIPSSAQVEGLDNCYKTVCFMI